MHLCPPICIVSSYKEHLWWIKQLEKQTRDIQDFRVNIDASNERNQRGKWGGGGRLLMMRPRGLGCKSGLRMIEGGD